MLAPSRCWATGQRPLPSPTAEQSRLAGEMDAAQLAMRAPQMLERKQITLRTGMRATAIDRAARCPVLENGERLPYSGWCWPPARARAPAPAWCRCLRRADLRSRDDASALSDGLPVAPNSGLPLLVIGGGFIGLEVAATARKRACPSPCWKPRPPAGPGAGPGAVRLVADLHRSHGSTCCWACRPRISLPVTMAG